MSFQLASYIKQLTSLYQTAFAFSQVRQEQPIYRVVKLPDELEEKISFQVVGTANVLKMLPEKIMRDNLLLGFNRADIAVITHLGTKNEIAASSKKTENKETRFFKILKQIVRNSETSFVVEKDTGETAECYASDLYFDEKIANNFYGKDAMKIGYSAAESHYKKVSELRTFCEEKSDTR